MNHFMKFFAVLFVLSLGTTISCTKNDPGPGGCAANFNYTAELQAEATALGNAASAYGQDPTTENCNAYKAAYQDYLDAAEDIKLCVPQADLAAYQQAIDDARDNLDALAC
ncbi:MAG: hypothetical protein R2824_18340 [Saprospiraceae bacterium]|nr:hypothetical protein [Lewinella sp.]